MTTEELRNNIDKAISVWLEANGVDKQIIANMDYSYINQDLDDLLGYLK